MNSSLIYALFANLSFSTGSQFFTHYTRKLGPVWMNCAKAVIATICFAITLCFQDSLANPAGLVLVLLMVSGFLGLGFGDTYLLRAFSSIGPGRTMMIFGFQPLFLGVMSYFLFDQTLALTKLIGIFFFIGCLFVIAKERQIEGMSFSREGITFALIGILCDSIGILLTRYAFEQIEMTSIEANFYRFLGALLFFVLIGIKKPIKLISIARTQSLKSKLYIVFGSVLGCYLSLVFYMNAVKTGHLASISAVAITGVFFSTVMELFIQKQKPTKSLGYASVFFLAGAWFIHF